jgi:signal peptidase I
MEQAVEKQSPPDEAKKSSSEEDKKTSAETEQRGFKRFIHQQVKPFVFIVLILCALRSSVADWNDVPTGSMNPSIIEGDRIFVNKLAYDLKVPFTTWHVAQWGDPSRGDVVVFYSPVDGVRLVKRVVGVPGDTIQLVENRLYVNGAPASYGPLDPAFAKEMQGRAAGVTFESEKVGNVSHPVMQLPHALSRSTYGPVVVPAGNFFVMGDNRDNSFDSRFWGFLDRNNIVGRASAVAISLDPDNYYLPRWHRFFHAMP